VLVYAGLYGFRPVAWLVVLPIFPVKYAQASLGVDLKHALGDQLVPVVEPVLGAVELTVFSNVFVLGGDLAPSFFLAR